MTQIGGTGVFVVAVRQALVDGRADVAVHSLKDLPTATDNFNAQRLYESLGYVRDSGYYTYCLDLQQR